MEGFDSTADGAPGELSFRRYGRYAEGGSALIWFEATAVLHEARSNPHQLWSARGTTSTPMPGWSEQTRQAARERIRSRDRHARPVDALGPLQQARRASPRPIIAHHSAVLDPMHNLPAGLSAGDRRLPRPAAGHVRGGGAAGGPRPASTAWTSRAAIATWSPSCWPRSRAKASTAARSRTARGCCARRWRESATRCRGVFVTTRMNVYDAIPYPYGFGVDRDDYQEPGPGGAAGG